MNRPAISVLLPAYNAAPFLGAAMASILRQTCRDFELLVIDDGSTDRTREIAAAVQDARVRVLANERNLGLSATLNRGLHEAHGEFVARQDADDRAEPERFARQLAAFRAQPELLLLGACGRQVDADGRSRGPLEVPQSALAIRWSMLFRNSFLHTSVMFRRAEVCAEFGGYDESLAICQDYELWSRIARQHPVANLREPLVTLRQHPASLMHAGRERLAAETQRVQLALIAAELPEARLTPRETELLARFQRRLSLEDVPEFWALFDRMRALFCAVHPAAVHDSDFRAALASQTARVGYNLLPEHRWAALRALFRAVRTHPAGAWRMPWGRVAALLLLGSSARRLYDRLAPTEQAFPLDGPA